MGIEATVNCGDCKLRRLGIELQITDEEERMGHLK